MKKLRDEQNIQNNRRANRLRLAMFGILAIMLTLRVITANLLVEKTSELSKFEATTAILESENALLKYQLERHTAMIELVSFAESSGFAPPARVKFISGPDVTALAR